MAAPQLAAPQRRLSWTDWWLFLCRSLVLATVFLISALFSSVGEAWTLSVTHQAENQWLWLKSKGAKGAVNASRKSAEFLSEPDFETPESA